MTDFDSTFRWRPTDDGGVAGRSRGSAAEDADTSENEAYLVVIAHPDEKALGTRYSLPRGRSIVIGRSSTADVRLPGIESISRLHTKLEKDQPFHVTCSLGIAGRAAEMSTFDDLYRAADRAMYSSKENGRNMVAVAEGS